MKTVSKSFRYAVLFAAIAASSAGVSAADISTLRAHQVLTTNPASIAPDPAQQLLSMARLLRNNDVLGLLQTSTSAEELSKLRAEYDAKRQLPVSEENRREFAESWGKLVSATAVDDFMKQIEPQLVEARPKMPGMLAMAMGAASIALASDDNELTPEQRESLKKVWPGVQNWLVSTDFLSSETMRKSLNILSQAARNTGITSLDQAKQLSFDQMLGKASNMIVAAKQSARLYDFDLDAVLDSLRITTLSNDGKKARIRTTVTLFDTAVSSEQDLEWVDGRWFGNDHFKLKEHSQDDKKAGGVQVEKS